MRKKLGIQAGTRVEFVERGDGGYELFAATGSIRELRGIISWSGPSATLEEMNEAVADAAAERYLGDAVA